MQVTRLHGGKSENTVALFRESIVRAKGLDRKGGWKRRRSSLLPLSPEERNRPLHTGTLKSLRFIHFTDLSASFRSSPYKSIRITSDLDPHHRHPRLIESFFLTSL